MQELGNRTEDSVIDFKWGTNAGDGSSITRATNGTISVYKNNSTTQTTAGVTDTEDFDTLTGVHHCRIDTSADAFYAVGSDYVVVLSGAVIDGKTVNAPLAHFTLEYGFNEVDVVKLNGVVQDLADLASLAAAYGNTGTVPIAAADIRSSVGLASANMDTQLGNLPTANENADALLDRADGVETGWTFRQVLRLIASVLCGKSSNGGKTFRDLPDTKARVTATVDASFNRTVVTKDAT